MNSTLTNPKRQSREMALQILFQTEFTSTVPYQDFLGLFENAVPTEIVTYADQLIGGVKTKKIEIDALIQSVSQHWKMDRMAMVDRNVLRIAVFEMKFSNSPLKASIAINEAVDIAKKYGSTESSGFVNGLLDQLRRENQWD